VRKGREIQLLSMHPPLGQVLVHQCNETVVVVPIQQVHHFVGNDVFQTRCRLFRQLQVQPETARFGGAGAPLGLHFLAAPVSNLDAQGRLPFLQERRD